MNPESAKRRIANFFRANLGQIRRAKQDDQLAIYRWLRSKFKDDAEN